MKSGMKSGIARIENSTDALPRSSSGVLNILINQLPRIRGILEIFTVDSQPTLIHLPLFLALFP